MDRDVLKIVTLLSEGASESAMEYYESGHIIEYQQYSSLKHLALENSEALANLTNETYTNVTDLISNAIEGTKKFADESNQFRAEVVFRIFQTMLFV